MADIKFSEFQKANQSKDSDEIAILQDGVNKMIPSPVLESKIINKTVSRVIDQGGASLNVINLKGVVPTYADLALITPTPELNDAYQVVADGLVYVYTESGFQADGDGFNLIQEPNGVVEEGNTEAVSGGEVYEKLSAIKGDFFNIKGSYVNASGVVVSNPSLETTEFLRLDKDEPIFIKGRGASSAPLVLFFDKSKKLISSIIGDDYTVSGFTIPVEDYPADAYFWKANSILNKGFIDHVNISNIEKDVVDILTNQGDLFSNTTWRINKQGALTRDSIRKTTPFLPFDSTSEYIFTDVFSDDSYTSAVYAYDINYKPISELPIATGEASIIVDSSNAPAGTMYLRANAKIETSAKVVVKSASSLSASLVNSERKEMVLNNVFVNKGYRRASDGVLVDTASTTLTSTDLIPVSSLNEGYILNASSNGNALMPMVFFDGQKQFISALTLPTGVYNLSIAEELTKVPTAQYYAVNAALINSPQVSTNWAQKVIEAFKHTDESVSNVYSTFVQKEEGKGLSENDFTNPLKQKVDAIQTDGTGAKYLSDDGTYKVVDSLSDAVFGGVIDDTQDLTGIDYKVWYFAKPGTYQTSDGSIVVGGGDISILTYNGSSWESKGIPLDASKDFYVVDTLSDAYQTPEYYLTALESGLLKGLEVSGVESSGDSVVALRYYWDPLSTETADGNIIIKADARAVGRFIRDGYQNYGQPVAPMKDATLHVGSSYRRKPRVAFTFDDGYLTDFTELKPFLDSFGIKGTVFINTRDSGHSQPKMTPTQIRNLYNNGWELGSHTASHSALYNLAIAQSIGIGDTTIKVNNSGSIPQFKPRPEGTKFYVRQSGSNIEHVFECNAYTLGGGVLEMTLVSPSSVAVSAPANIYLTEEDVYKEVIEPKQFLESIGIPCVGLATPWGEINDISKQIVQNVFEYSRNASASQKFVNGGVYDTDDIRLNQYTLYCSEIVDLSEAEMDSLIAETISKEALLIVLGHTNGWTNLQAKLTTFIGKMQAAGLAHGTLEECLMYHSNAANIGDFQFLKNGQPQVTVLPRGTFKNELSVSGVPVIGNLPVGISYMRVTTADAAGLPENSGIIKTERAKNISFSNNWWQTFYGGTGSVYYRKGLSATTATRWKKIGGDTGTVFPTTNNVVGDQFFRTDLKKNFWYDGTTWYDAMGTAL